MLHAQDYRSENSFISQFFVHIDTHASLHLGTSMNSNCLTAKRNASHFSVEWHSLNALVARTRTHEQYCHCARTFKSTINRCEQNRAAHSRYLHTNVAISLALHDFNRPHIVPLHFNSQRSHNFCIFLFLSRLWVRQVNTIAGVFANHLNELNRTRIHVNN